MDGVKIRVRIRVRDRVRVRVRHRVWGWLITALRVATFADPHIRTSVIRFLPVEVILPCQRVIIAQ